MGLDLSHGGHLTHGHPLNFSGKYFKVIPFTVDPKTELIDYDLAEKLAKQHKPQLICVGASAYSRVIDWERFRKIADKVQAIFMADMAHYAGLVAAGIYPSPVPYADIVTTTTHKTLRGPRGGLILYRQKFEKEINRSVFPGVQGGPLMHVIAAKAVAFHEALKAPFKSYQKQVLKNAKAFAEALGKKGFRIVTGGTDSHLFLVDLRSKGISGKEAEILLDEVGITVNKNTIPYDPEKPMVTSGIRIGTPAITTRGMKEKEMLKIAEWIDQAIQWKDSPKKRQALQKELTTFCRKFPLETH